MIFLQVLFCCIVTSSRISLNKCWIVSSVPGLSKLVILFSSTMSFPYSESAPVTEIKLDIDWIQCPCGKASTVTFDESIESSENSSGSSKQSYISSSETRDSIQKIVRSGSIAIKNAEIFKKEFVSTFIILIPTSLSQERN